MSEYQYYEFLAVDRQLTAGEMQALRAVSSRARITPSGFVNEYNWGDLRADPRDLVARYFDLFLYYANWNTCRLMVRLPRALFDPATAEPYCAADSVSLHVTSEHVILDITSRDEMRDREPPYWAEAEQEEGGPGLLATLVPLRAELMRGDRRLLYLGWLLAAQNGDLPDETEEPPRPTGLDTLPAPLARVVQFLGIDRDLVAVAAAAPGEVGPDSLPAEAVVCCVEALPEEEKTELLLRFIEGDDPHLAPALLRRFAAAHRGEAGAAPGAAGPRRTAGELLEAAERHAEARRQEELAREAAARARRLDALTAREPQAWEQVEALIEERQARPYDEAATLLRELRDLAAHAGRMPGFDERLRALRSRHARKSAFIARLDRSLRM